MTDELRVAIPIPTSGDLEYNRRSWPMYAEAVRQAGGVPVPVELDISLKDVTELFRRCHGVVLPGSPADVSPTRYGQTASAECAPADLLRESVDRILLEEAYAARKPILGICYGAQSLNVWRGGTLVQDLVCTPINHAVGAAVAVAHSISVQPAAILDRVIDRSEGISTADGWRLLINSSHHQAVERVGDGLRISAVASEDGVVEAVEGAGEADAPEFVLGVQWHPERSVGISSTSRAIFDAFCKYARIWAEERVEVERR